MDASIPNHRTHDQSETGGSAVQEWERTYAVWTHRGTLIACILAVCSIGIGFWAPPVFAMFMWLNKRERSAFIDDHAKEALNFAISLVIYSGIAFVGGLITLGLGWVLFGPTLAILTFVGFLSASRHANRGAYYRYPMCLRLVG